MSSSKKHVQKAPGRNAPARRRGNSRARKRRGAFRSNLSFSLRALCALSVLLVVLAGITFATDSFKLPTRTAGKTANLDRVYAPTGLENPTAEPTMEVLAPENPQRSPEPSAQPPAEERAAAAVPVKRGGLAQLLAESNSSPAGAKALPNPADAARNTGAAVPAMDLAVDVTLAPTMEPVADVTLEPTMEPTMEPVADVTREPTAKPATNATPAPVSNPAASTLIIGGNANTNSSANSEIDTDDSWSVLDGIPQTDQPLGLRKSQWVVDSYFDDTVFVGDSVTQKLQQYVAEKRKSGDSTLLGNARFIAVQSLGTHTALADVSEKSLHPTVRGTKMTIESALASLGAKKVYIMLGMNDVAVSGMQTSVSNMLKFLQRIQSEVPGIEIFVQSATPRLSGSQPTTEQLFEYNLRVYEELLKLNDPRIHFVDVAYAMRDDTGKLYEDYCSDKTGMALHFTNAGCQKWVEYLYTHAYTRR